VGRGPTEALGDDDGATGSAQTHRPDPLGRTAIRTGLGVVDLNAECAPSGVAGSTARPAVDGPAAPVLLGQWVLTARPGTGGHGLARPGRRLGR
jgi:hypothetical protein